METIVDKYGVEYDIKQKILIKASPDLKEEYIVHPYQVFTTDYYSIFYR